MSSQSRARGGVLAGGGMAAAGVGLWLGAAAALMVGGVLLVAYCLFVADVGGDSS
ncbi:hypothetical protein [Streptomyces sp. NPDC059071]|uniref:hypothetical protein n=1 Tax=unclassified Streptomyces TaxID=2593676 RepID=UPI00364E69B1